MKRMFLPVQANGKLYKLFADDVKKIHKQYQRRLPRIPSYGCDEDDFTSDKEENYRL